MSMKNKLTNISYKRCLLSVFFIGVISFNIQPAHAIPVFDPTVAANVLATKVQQEVQRIAHENWLQVFQTQLEKQAEQFKQKLNDELEQLTDMDFNKLAAQTAQNTNSQITAEANMNQQKENLATTRAVQGKTYDAMRSATTGASICNNITGAIRTANFDKAKEIYQAQLVQQTMAAGNGFAGNTFIGGVNFDNQLNAYHCANNASLNDVKNHRCTKVTETSTNDTKDPNSTLPTTSGDTNANIVLGHSDFSEKDQQNFNNMMVILHNQAMGTPPNVGSMDPSTPQGRLMIKEQAEKDALTSIGMTAMENVGAEHSVINLGDNDTMQQDGAKWAEATAANVVGYNKDASGKYFPNGVSNQDITELRSKSWYYNPQTNLREGAQNESASLKDIASMMSWQQVMNFKILQTLQSIQYTLGALQQMEAGHEGILSGQHDH